MIIAFCHDTMVKKNVLHSIALKAYGDNSLKLKPEILLPRAYLKRRHE